MAASPYVPHHLPDLATQLEAYPQAQSPEVESFFYWSKDVYNAAKPVVTVTHVYLNRSQLDVLGGMFGFLKRSVLEGRIRRDTPQILRALRDRLESGEPTGEPLNGKRVLPKKFIAYRKSFDPHIR